jgi:hypothetical protein
MAETEEWPSVSGDDLKAGFTMTSLLAREVHGPAVRSGASSTMTAASCSCRSGLTARERRPSGQRDQAAMIPTTSEGAWTLLVDQADMISHNDRWCRAVSAAAASCSDQTMSSGCRSRRMAVRRSLCARAAAVMWPASGVQMRAMLGQCTTATAISTGSRRTKPQIDSAVATTAQLRYIHY